MHKKLTYFVAGPNRRRHRTSSTAPTPIFPRLIQQNHLLGRLQSFLHTYTEKN